MECLDKIDILKSVSQSFFDRTDHTDPDDENGIAVTAIEWAIDQLRWRRVENERPEPRFYDIYPHLGIEWLLYYSVDDDPLIEFETKHHGLPDAITHAAIAWRPVDITDLPEEK